MWSVWYDICELTFLWHILNIVWSILLCQHNCDPSVVSADVYYGTKPCTCNSKQIYSILSTPLSHAMFDLRMWLHQVVVEMSQSIAFSWAKKWTKAHDCVHVAYNFIFSLSPTMNYSNMYNRWTITYMYIHVEHHSTWEKENMYTSTPQYHSPTYNSFNGLEIVSLPNSLNSLENLKWHAAASMA